MDAARWQRIRLLFEEAAVLPSADRPAYLEAESAGNDQLRREVERLLAADSAPEGIFTESPESLAAGILDGAAVDPLRLGPYRTVGVLGRGGMGQVYLARLEHGDTAGADGGEVAIKVLRRGMDSEDVLRRFRAEGHILGRLQHPNIARFYDSGMTDDGRPFLVMECLDCLSLTAYCDAHRLPIPERLRLFRDACAAVQHAHEQGIVHRDLKPGNVVVTDEGEVKLLDFGIAKVLDAELLPLSAVRTRTGFLVLTPEYASPEQIRGGKIGPATDVYGLGALLYELLAGHRPYRLAGVRGPEIERIVCEEQPTLPSVRAGESRDPDDGDGVVLTPKGISAARSTSPAGLRHKLSGPLDAIVMAALRKEPERRYASVAALARDVDRYLEGEGVRARRESPSYRIRSFARRHRLQLVSALAVVGLAIGVLGGAATLLRSSGTTSAAAAERPTQNPQAYIYYLRGNEFNRYEEDAENLARAASMYEQAVAHDPAFAEAHARLSIADSRLWFYHFDHDPQRLAAAKEHAERALVLDPDLPDSYLALGMYYYFGKADYSQARQYFEQALALQPDYAEALRSMAWVLRRQGGLREALSYFERLDRLDPLGADVLAIAFTRQLLRDYPASDRAYSRVLERGPDTPLLHALRARMLVAWSGDVAGARRVLDEGRGRSVDNDFTRITAVELDLLAGDDRRTLDRLSAMRQEVLESQIHYAPTAHLNARAERGLGDLQTARRHEEEARQLLEAHLKAHPDDPRAYATLGRVYAGLGRADDAVRAGEKAVELVPIESDAIKGPVFVSDLAAVYTMVGRYEDAIDQLEILLAHPGMASAQLLRIDPTWKPLRGDPRFAALVGGRER